MAVSGQDAVAELAALRVAVRRLLELAGQLTVNHPGQFAKLALERGLKELDDPSYWGVPEGMNASFRADAKRRYADLFSDL